MKPKCKRQNKVNLVSRCFLVDCCLSKVELSTSEYKMAFKRTDIATVLLKVTLTKAIFIGLVAMVAPCFLHFYDGYSYCSFFFGLVLLVFLLKSSTGVYGIITIP